MYIPAATRRAMSSNLEIRPSPAHLASRTNRCICLTGINNEAAQFCDSRRQIMGIIIRRALREVARAATWINHVGRAL